jgi:Phosphate-selective porin O and P
MKTTMKGPIMAMAAAIAGAAGAQSSDTNEEVARLKAAVADLQQQVSSLQATEQQNWLTQKRAEEVRALVQDVLADADTRATLLETGVTAGYDKGFFIGSTDGNWLMRIYGQLQVRYVYDHRDDPPDAVPDQNRQGFEVRRAKIGIKGNVFDPTWQYDVLLAVDRNTSNAQGEDNIWIQKDLGDGFKVKVGQMKAPYLYEDVLSSTRLFAVERSLFNSFFTAATIQGINASYEAQHWRITGTYNDGNGSGSTSNMNKGWQAEDTEWGQVGARVDFLLAGDWKQMVDYDAWRGEDTAFMVGIASNYQKSEFGTGHNLPLPDFNNNEVGNLGFTIDAIAKFGGFGVSGAFAYRKLDPQSGDTLDQYGFYVQGGFFLADDWELYGRYEWINADVSSIDDLSVITVGVTKFWDKHNLKWQTDVGYGINSVDAIFAQSSAGWQPDSPDQDGQIVIRSQFQLLF